MDHLGKNVEYLRKLKGWTQVQLGRAAGLSSGTISRLESGDIGYSRESIAKLAGALKVEPERLVSSNLEDTGGVVRRVPNLANSKDYIYSPLDVSARAVYVEVMDEAMESQIACGDRVIADPAVIYETGSLVVARTNRRSSGIVRLFRARSEQISDGYDLVAINSLYAPITHEEPGCEIIGPAVALFRIL